MPFGSALFKFRYLFQFKGYLSLLYISLNSQKKEISELMSYMKILKEVTKRRGQELEN